MCKNVPEHRPQAGTGMEDGLISGQHNRKMKVLSRSVLSSLCDPMDCRLLGSSVHGILQARILEWVAIPFSRGSSRPKDQAHISRMGRETEPAGKLQHNRSKLKW